MDHHTACFLDLRSSFCCLSGKNSFFVVFSCRLKQRERGLILVAAASQSIGHPLTKQPFLGAAWGFFNLTATKAAPGTNTNMHTVNSHTPSETYAPPHWDTHCPVYPNLPSHTPTLQWSCQPLLSLSPHVTPFWGHSPQRPPLPYSPPLLSSLLPPLPALLPGHPFARVIYRSKR